MTDLVKKGRQALKMEMKHKQLGLMNLTLSRCGEGASYLVEVNLQRDWVQRGEAPQRGAESRPCAQSSPSSAGSEKYRSKGKHTWFTCCFEDSENYERSLETHKLYDS